MLLNTFTDALSALLPDVPAKIAVAVSGGGDSFALLHMAQQWAQAHNTSIVALTVDHQLRLESADEAALVAAWCKRNGIEHHTLQWRGPKPVTAIQAAARNARRHLMCRFCQENAVPFLLLGHQADDQAETLLMRLQRGSGLTGLRVMQPFTRDKATGIALVRPLLHMRRHDLRQYCLQYDLPFIDDPSNDKTEFERVRMRHALAALPDLAGGISRSASRLKRADDTLNHMAQIWFHNHAAFPEPGHIWLEEDALNDLLPEIRLRALNQVVAALDMASPSLAQMEKLSARMEAEGFTGLNIAGCWVRPKVLNRKKGFIFQSEPIRKT